MFTRAGTNERRAPRAGPAAQPAARQPVEARRPANAVWTGLALGGRVPSDLSHPNDASEHEADRVADAVMRAPASHDPVTLAGETPSRVPAFSDPLGAGTPLDTPTRTWFETRLGTDLGGVRIHTDSAAGRAARDLNAHAFTVGSHIAFADGQYSPTTGSGRHLIAHELAHVLQGGTTVHRSAVPGTAPPSLGEGERRSDPIYVPASTPRAPTIPSPEVCPPPKDMPCYPASTPPGTVTKTYQFDQDSAALTSLQRTDIDTVASAWHTAGGSVTIRVDGYASAEGACDYNWGLSCRRARAVRDELATPSDGSAGVTSASLEVYAHGESDEAGRALRPNRRATISVPVPPPPPPPSPVPAPCTLPVLLGVGRTGCGSGTDFTHYDFPSISVASEAKLAAWALAHPLPRPSRSLVTDTECEAEMDAVLTGFAFGDGHAAFLNFVSGSGSPMTHGPASTLGAMALISGSFLATVAAVQRAIEAQLAAQASSGALDPCKLAVTPPATSFGVSDGMPLKAVIGGTHGERLFADTFTGSIPLRTYTITLHFILCDNFGVDEADLYAPGLMGFWVLQHERSASLYAPFINVLDLPVTVSGTF